MLDIVHQDGFQIFHCKVDSEDGLVQIQTSLEDDDNQYIVLMVWPQGVLGSIP